jgi:predicted AAA+ superfamily ATPase
MKAQEMEQGFQKIWELFAETDLNFKETDRNFKETDRKFQETDRKFQETEQELHTLFSKTDAKIEALTGKWSRFVEGLIAPAVQRLFQAWNIEVDRVYQRVRAYKNGDGLEVDILAVNGEYAVLIEAKSTLGVDDVREHIARLEKFKTFFPEYADRKVIGAVAGIVIDEDADKFAYRNGLFVIAQSGEVVTILNDAQFRPKQW